MRRTSPAALSALVLTLLLALLVAGCSGSDGTGDKGYVDGTGVITQLDPGDRDEPGEVSGTTLEGEDISLDDFRGKVVVVNVWGSWCPPCRAEADELVEAAERLQPGGEVAFLGINTRDNSSETALAFQRSRKVPYPSIFDPGGRTLLAFRGTLTPASIPSTVIIDRQGRVAASILGQLPSVTTLVELVTDAQKTAQKAAP